MQAPLNVRLPNEPAWNMFTTDPQAVSWVECICFQQDLLLNTQRGDLQ